MELITILVILSNLSCWWSFSKIHMVPRRDLQTVLAFPLLYISLLSFQQIVL